MRDTLKTDFRVDSFGSRSLAHLLKKKGPDKKDRSTSRTGSTGRKTPGKAKSRARERSASRDKTKEPRQRSSQSTESRSRSVSKCRSQSRFCQRQIAKNERRERQSAASTKQVRKLKTAEFITKQWRIPGSECRVDEVRPEKRRQRWQEGRRQGQRQGGEVSILEQQQREVAYRVSRAVRGIRRCHFGAKKRGRLQKPPLAQARAKSARIFDYILHLSLYDVSILRMSYLHDTDLNTSTVPVAVGAIMGLGNKFVVHSPLSLSRCREGLNAFLRKVRCKWYFQRNGDQENRSVPTPLLPVLQLKSEFNPKIDENAEYLLQNL